MPRTLRPQLRRMLERANPNVATFVELAVPDAQQILRRAEDQFFTSPDPLVSMSPAVSAQASPSGAMTLASVAANLFTQMADSGTYFFLPQEQGSETFHGTVGWTLAPAFTGAVLRAVTAKLRWIAPTIPDVALQIYRVHRTAGVLQRQEGTSLVETQAVQYTFVPLLQQPVVRRFRDIPGAALFTNLDVTFDLTGYRLTIDPISSPPPGPAESGDLPEYFFEIRPLLQGQGNFVGWVKDTTSARNINGLGTIREVGWQRKDPNDPASMWVRTEQNDSLCLKVDVEQYVPTSTLVYHIQLPAVPTAESTGRVAFTAGSPAGSLATLQLSTDGGSTYALAENGDPVSVRQRDYHLKLTMAASGDRQHSPIISALGIEFRRSVDLSPESTLEPMSQGVSVPFLAASVGEGAVTVVRTGRRDYRDVGALVASQGPDTQLEIDAYLGSRHPQVTRDDWFHTTRAQVSSRTPTGTAEQFSLLSIAKTLKRKLPARLESISSVHTVVGTPSPTTTQIRVTPQLIGASPTGNEYDGQGYYLRVRTSSQAGVETGTVFLIGGNTGIDRLDFPANADPTLSKELPGTLAIGDEVEVHSSRYQQPAISWVNADPADVWLEILTVHLGVPDDRIGLADVGASGRAGRPPKVTDRAPGDATTQAKCKVTLKLTEAEDGDALIDQLSFLMGGATIEIAGQIVFRQIYALRDASGTVTVAPDPVAATFGARDYADLDTPTGREQRITVLACDYGVDTTSAAALPTATATFVDVDALAAYQLQDVEGLGTAAVPDEIARWCYNATDLGLFLASQAAQQVVQACSTGLRLWSWTTVDAHPELTVGDTVGLITDRYTDYDPARGVAVKGWAAYPLVLVSTAAGGRRFVGFLQGLSSVVGVDVRGGDGTLQDNNVAPTGVGPSLDVTAVAGPTTYTVTYTAADGALALYIDGAGPSAVPASPFTVARPTAGSQPLHYTIQITGTNGQVLSDMVEILAVGGADSDTVTPNLTLTPSGSDPNYTDFLATASNPAGGSAPTIAVLLSGVTGENLATFATIADGVATAVTSGQTIRVFRGLPGAVAQATATFTASIVGGGSEVIQRTIPPQTDAVAGQQILSDPAFAQGLAKYSVYDNLTSGHVHLSIVTDTTAPNATGKLLRLNVDSATTPGTTTNPGFGGVRVSIPVDAGAFQKDTYHRGAMIVWRVRANIPVGYTINWAANAFGTGSTVTPLTPMVGTGNWFDYQWVTQVGTTGTFSTIGFWYLTGSGTGPIQWDVAQVTGNDKHQTPTFGPSLDVVATPGTPNYSISYTASGGTVQLSINGGAYATAPASPISVARPGAGAAPASYAFKLVADGQTITDEVTIPSIDADTDTNTVSPDLSLEFVSTTDTVVWFRPHFSNPAGGSAPVGTVTLHGVTAVIAGLARADGSTSAVVDGSDVQINRPAFGGANTANQPTVQFRATIGGGGSETIERTILPQVKESFGPSLVVATTPSSSSYSIAYTAVGAVTLSIDGGAASAAPASPIVVSRDASDHVYVLYATADNRTMSHTEAIPKIEPPTAVINNVTIGSENYTSNTLVVAWSFTGSIGSGSFEVIQIRTSGSSEDLSGTQVSQGTSTSGSKTINLPDDIITTTGPKVTYSYQVRVLDAAGTTIRVSSPWVSRSYSTV